ncbi:MAG: putative baseplate assembly protein [Fimbriimonadaceae bacterium]|nr:putative baseplate assembly protein [Fimbriimonadaceae bacterium]
MSDVYVCGKQRRLEAVRTAGVLNGIDFLEVRHPAQTTLDITFVKSPAGLTVQNFRIEGGVRVTNIAVTGAPINGNVVSLTVDRPGDFSTYVLRVVAGPGDDAPPAGYDSQLCAVEFSFKVACPSDFDCAPLDECPPVTPEMAEIDYLAKDYPSFRRLMLDRMRVTRPEWTERNPSDFQVALVEMLAYVADHLSYAQDAVATEGYLGTARRRTSVRRIARMLDYPVHEGCAARTFVCFEVLAGSGADGQTIPKGTPILDKALASTPAVTQAVYDSAGESLRVFETLHDVTIRSSRNTIKFHTWSDLDCCLPQGSTSATLLVENGLTLAPGDLLSIEEVKNPTGLTGNGADPRNRHVVRLTKVTPDHDDHENVDVLQVEWARADALPFPVCLSVTHDEETITDVSVACANVVLADCGRTRQPELPIPSAPDTDSKFEPTLVSADVTFATPYSHQDMKNQPAMACLKTDPKTSIAEIGLDSVTPDLLGNPVTTRVWRVQSDLLGSGPFDAHFVAEPEHDRTVRLRFGNGINGMAPQAGDTLLATVRTCNGKAGNVGHDALKSVVTSLVGLQRVWNPLPGLGGVDPENLNEVRRDAPEAFKVQERAVTEADYEEMALRHPEVQNAKAQFRWTGSWYTVFLAIDRLGGLPVMADEAFKTDMLNHIDRYRMMGTDIEVRGPNYVPLDIELEVCVAPGAFRGNVLQDLAKTFSAGTLPDGTLGFFHPDRFTFGQEVYLSQILAAAMLVRDVDHVRATKFQRWGKQAVSELGDGYISISTFEIAQLKNDPNFPEQGRIVFSLDGGL